MDWKIIEYGPFVAIALILGAVAGLLWIGRRNRFFLPKGWRSWIGATLALFVIASSALFLAFSTYIRAISEESEAIAGETEQEAPPLHFKLVLTEEEQALADYEGQVVLLNFWATWCVPCIAEMPALNTLQEQYEDEGLVVVLLSDESREEIVTFFTDKPSSFVSGQVETDETLMEPYRKMLRLGRPMTFLVDRGGVIREIFTGAETYDSFRESVEKYL